MFYLCCLDQHGGVAASETIFYILSRYHYLPWLCWRWLKMVNEKRDFFALSKEGCLISAQQTRSDKSFFKISIVWFGFKCGLFDRKRGQMRGNLLLRPAYCHISYYAYKWCSGRHVCPTVFSLPPSIFFTFSLPPSCLWSCTSCRITLNIELTFFQGITKRKVENHVNRLHGRDKRQGGFSYSFIL